MTVIDAHHHVWDLAVRDQPWITGPAMAAIRRSFTLDDLRPHARAAGVDATVLVQTVDRRRGDTGDARPRGRRPAGGRGRRLDRPHQPGRRRRAGPARRRARRRHLVSIRHQVQSEPDPDWLRRPDVIRGLRAVAAAGLCYDLVVRPHQLPAAIYAAAAVPGLTLVLDHAGKPRDRAATSTGWARGAPRTSPRCRTRCASCPGW